MAVVSVTYFMLLLVPFRAGIFFFKTFFTPVFFFFFAVVKVEGSYIRNSHGIRSEVAISSTGTGLSCMPCLNMALGAECDIDLFSFFKTSLSMSGTVASVT